MGGYLFKEYQDYTSGCVCIGMRSYKAVSAPTPELYILPRISGLFAAGGRIDVNHFNA